MHFPKGFLAAFSNFWNRIFPSRVRIYALISKLYRMIIRKRYILSIEIVGRIVYRFFFLLERWNWKIIFYFNILTTKLADISNICNITT